MTSGKKHMLKVFWQHLIYNLIEYESITYQSSKAQISIAIHCVKVNAYVKHSILEQPYPSPKN